MPRTKIAEIASSQLNELVEIRGHIVSAWDLTKGRKYVVRDDSGQIPLLLWDSVLEGVEGADQMRAGSEVAAIGRVSEYKGELRVVPAEGSDVQLLALVDDRDRAVTSLASLPEVGAGDSVWVTGTIVGMETFSKGVKLRIADGTGEATVLLWQSIYDSLPARDDLMIDAQIGIFGDVSHYRDDWEIVPRSKTEIVVLAKP